MGERYETTERIIDDSGIWGGGRREQYGFVLTPEIYRLNHDEMRQLEVIGKALYPVMKGFGKIMSASEDPRRARGRTWDILRRVSTIGVPRIHRRLQVQFPDAYPLLFKIDLLRSEGKFWIVEFDGMNTHGFGYTVLLNRIRETLVPENARRLNGIAPTLAMHRIEHYPNNKLFCFVGSNSRFYDPYYRLFCNDLANRGVQTVYGGEWMSGQDDFFTDEARIALQFPMFRNDSPLQHRFAERYEQGLLEFLIPPKVYMGSKSVMALLKNSAEMPELEQILRSEIDGESLDALRAYIPETHLIYSECAEKVTKALGGKSWVLKHAISSGMKGTSFVAPHDVHVGTLVEKRPYQVILQEELHNDPFPFAYYEGKELKSDTWFCRFTAHYNFAELVEIDITARRDKIIHGATDCLMCSAILP